MSATWILKFPQVDQPKQPILIHVTQKQNTNIDLDLIATDGEEVYKGKVRERNLSKLQSQNFEGTDEEWTSLLRHALVSKQASPPAAEQIKSLEVDCVISGKGNKAKLSVTLRNKIEDITHKLGAVELSHSENTDDVDLFGWACQLADQRNDLETRAVSLDREAESTQNTVTTLQTQLKDLVKAKEAHEEQLLAKFAALLNEKKLKIRDQQRVLRTATVDEEKLAEVHLSNRKVSKGKGSTKRKRGSDVLKAEDTIEDDDSDGFDPMEVDADQAKILEEENAASGQDTPTRSSTVDTETASESEMDTAPTQPVSRTKAKETKSKVASPLPKARALPFQKKGQKAESPKKAADAPPKSTKDDEETESEDDEL